MGRICFCKIKWIGKISLTPLLWRNICMSSIHTPGKENTVCPGLGDNTKWQLAPVIFANIVHTYFVLELDLLVSCFNVQVSSYVLCFSNLNGLANDSFSLSWENKKFYAFLSFSLIGAALAKIRKDQSTGIMINPYWWGSHWCCNSYWTFRFSYHRQRKHWLHHQRKGKFTHCIQN